MSSSSGSIIDLTGNTSSNDNSESYFENIISHERVPRSRGMLFHGKLYDPIPLYEWVQRNPIFPHGRQPVTPHEMNAIRRRATADAAARMTAVAAVPTYQRRAKMTARMQAGPRRVMPTAAAAGGASGSMTASVPNRKYVVFRTPSPARGDGFYKYWAYKGRDVGYVWSHLWRTWTPVNHTPEFAVFHGMAQTAAARFGMATTRATALGDLNPETITASRWQDLGLWSRSNSRAFLLHACSFLDAAHRGIC